MIGGVIVDLVRTGVPAESIVLLTRSNASNAATLVERVLRNSGVSVHRVRELRHWRDDEIARFVSAWLLLVFEGGPHARRGVLELAWQRRSIINEDSSLERDISDRVRQLTKEGRLIAGGGGVSASALVGVVETALDEVYGLNDPIVRGQIIRQDPTLDGDGLKVRVANLLQELAALRERTGNWVQAVRRARGEGAVHVATVHGSKGLEYETVVLLDVNDAVYRDLHAADAAKALSERSVLYVAVTRAKSRLLIATGVGGGGDDSADGFLGAIRKGNMSASG